MKKAWEGALRLGGGDEFNRKLAPVNRGGGLQTRKIGGIRRKGPSAEDRIQVQVKRKLLTRKTRTKKK